MFTNDPLRALAIWKGGLSIWGAVIGGGLAAAAVARRRGVNALDVLDVVAPGVALAQAIGRWGNYFNQELFGRPTDLPWALRIDPRHRPAGFAGFSTFHPVFLYESLYCLAIFATLLAVERCAPLRRGQTVALYVVLYTFGRFWLENLRIDPANEIAGLRVNAWFSAGTFVAGAVWFVWLGRHQPRQQVAMTERPSSGADASS